MARPTSLGRVRQELRRAREETRGRPKPPPLPARSLWKNGGRAWINGSEVGGSDPRFAHLNRSYD